MVPSVHACHRAAGAGQAQDAEAAQDGCSGAEDQHGRAAAQDEGLSMDAEQAQDDPFDAEDAELLACSGISKMNAVVNKVMENKQTRKGKLIFSQFIFGKVVF